MKDCIHENATPIISEDISRRGAYGRVLPLIREERTPYLEGWQCPDCGERLPPDAWDLNAKTEGR